MVICKKVVYGVRRVASFCHSQAHHAMFSLACLVFSLQPYSALHTSVIQPVLRSTCTNHLILLVRSTTSKSWMPSFVRREFLCLDSEDPTDHDTVITPETVQCIYRHGPSICCMQRHTSHMLSTPDLWSEGAYCAW